MPRAREFAFLIAMIERPAAAGERAVAMIEAEFLRTLFGLGAEMPFAGDRRVIAGRFQRRGQRHRVPGQARGFCAAVTPKRLA